MEFLIVAKYRTGSNLISYILDAHPDIRCYGERTGYDAFVNGNMSPTDKPHKGYSLKLTEWVPFVTRDLLPIIFTERDIIDCVSSAKEFKYFNGSMLKWKFVQYVESRLHRESEFDLAFSKETDLLESLISNGDMYGTNSPEYEAACGALYYKWMFSYPERYKKLGYPTYICNYERLTTNPEIVLREICDFLKVPWSDNLLHHQDFPHEDRKEGDIRFFADKTAINPGSVGKGRKTLSESEIRACEMIIHADWSKWLS